MNFRKIIDHVKEHGGISYSVTYGDVSNRNGYVVSPYKELEVTMPLKELNENEVRNFYLENAELLTLTEDHLIGIWIENDIAYLDVSVFVSNKKEASKIAREKNQKAYYDLVKQETIYV